MNFNDMIKANEKQMAPFSNGTEAMMWYDANCSRCTKAYFPAKDGDWPKDSTMKQYVSCGKECKLKYHIDWGFVTGEIPQEIAQQIGEDEYGLKQTCLLFSDNEDDGYKPPKRPRPDNTPPNQLLMPFYLQEIGIKELTYTSKQLSTTQQ